MNKLEIQKTKINERKVETKIDFGKTQSTHQLVYNKKLYKIYTFLLKNNTQ